jgi:tetratricopeptide (TPR) repeat protein
MSTIETAERLEGKGDYLGSLELVLKVLENEPNNVRALELKASLCYVIWKSPEAIRAYKQLLRFYGSNGKIWSQLYALSSISSIYRRLKNFDKAISYCEKSIELCERFLKIDSPQKDDFIDQLIETLWVLGEYQYKSRKYSCAIDTYKKLLRLLSEFGCLEAIVGALYELACAYYKLNRTTEALSKYSETLKIHGVLGQTLYTSWTHYYVASIHFAARDYEKALFHVEKCVLLMVKIYGKNIFVGIEDDPVYKRAKRLQNSLKKNKFLWKKYK